ncbi:hypothetical protein A2335_04570 [Candidatus Peregrinibacteria bacterium RIFOXYB2_FULL_32_7]|nr:MAG: hypothetical protein A2335_04570 [Candidatus Peregrinibacteria bacterium RIFOXYB2_FULL_32_7]
MKLKTHSGSKKRIKAKKNAAGKIKFSYQKAARKHLLCNKSKSQKGLPGEIEVSKGNTKILKKLLPYG